MLFSLLFKFELDLLNLLLDHFLVGVDFFFVLELGQPQISILLILLL